MSDEPSPEQPEAEKQINGVIVQPQSQNGGFSVSINTVGDIRLTEVLAILELAVKNARRMIDGE